MRRLALVITGLFLAKPAPAQTSATSSEPTGAAETGESADANVAAARLHFRNGIKLYQDANYAGALAEFEAAYALKPTAASLQNVALSLKALYRYAQAAETLDALLERHDADLTDAERETVRVARDELLALLSTVRLSTSPADAKLVIDGRSISAAERRGGIRLDVGEHTVEASAPGHASLRKVIRVAAGQEPAAVEVTLRPVAGFIAVRSTDSEAAIAIDGQPKAYRSFRGPVSPGRHYVQIYKPGHQALERVVVVELGKTVIVEGAPGPRRDPDAPAPPPTPSRKKEPISGGGWYGLVTITPQRPTNPPADFDQSDANIGGGSLGLRGGYRIWKAVALELMIDGAQVDVRNACDESLGESSTGGCTAPAVERDYSIASFRIGPNLRIMSTSDRLRFVGTLGMGAVNHAFKLGDTPGGGGGGKDTSNDPYLLLELGGEINFGHVLLGLGISLFFDGGSDLSVDGRDLYPEKSDGLGFVGLALRGGISQWAPR